MHSRHIRDPEHLSINLETAQSVLRQIFLFQTEKREVRQIAKYGLEPTMLRHDLAHARVIKLIDVERQHRDVLRGAGRGDRVKNRLREIFAEVNSDLLELQNFRNLL